MPDAPVITVAEFYRHAPPELALRVAAGGDGLATHQLHVARIQKIGLVLAGFPNYVHSGRVQILGQSESEYLRRLSAEARRAAITLLKLENISCILVTAGNQPPAELLAAADAAVVPILLTPALSSQAITLVTEFLQERLAPQERRHGVLLAMLGLGVLLEGASGIGKSECALDLITRGHRLVADDVVEVKRIGRRRLVGSAPELIRNCLEIRGLGILNIRDLFGVSAISATQKIHLVIHLQRWTETIEVDRLGLEPQTTKILDVEVPQFVLPVRTGRNLSTLVETAVRVHLLRLRGHNAAQTLVERHSQLLLREQNTGDENEA